MSESQPQIIEDLVEFMGSHLQTEIIDSNNLDKIS